LKYELASSRESPTIIDSAAYKEPVKNAVSALFKKRGLTSEPHILLGNCAEASIPKIVGLLLPISDLRQITNATVMKLNADDGADNTGSHQTHIYCIYFKRYSRSHLEYVIRLFRNNAFLHPDSGFTISNIAWPMDGFSFCVEDLHNYQLFESWNALQLLCYCYTVAARI